MESFNRLETTSSLSQLSDDLTNLSVQHHQKFLRFALGSQDRGLLPLEQIAEVLSVTIGEILPLPQMPSCVLGIYNWRGKMLWLIDLNNLVDYPPLRSPARESPLMAMVIQINGQSMGLVVQYVKDIELYDPEQFQKASIDVFPPRLLPFVKGYLPSANGIVLDTQAIARYPLWQIHQS